MNQLSYYVTKRLIVGSKDSSGTIINDIHLLKLSRQQAPAAAMGAAAVPLLLSLSLGRGLPLQGRTPHGAAAPLTASRRVRLRQYDAAAVLGSAAPYASRVTACTASAGTAVPGLALAAMTTRRERQQCGPSHRVQHGFELPPLLKLPQIQYIKCMV